MRRQKNSKGITLIALIITIIVLLILAVVAIGAVQNDGIIEYAKNARDEYGKAQANEQTTLGDYLAKIEGNIPGGSSGNKELVIEEDAGPWTKIKNLPQNGGYDSTTKVNMPKLGTELTAVVLDTDKEEFTTNGTWYNYEAQSGTTENGGTSKWANAVTTDGEGNITGYYVWIPRYAYKITSGYHTSTTGTIEVKFLKDTTNEFADGTGTAETDPSKITYTDGVQNEWLVHPAFQADASIGGGFGTGGGITGLWVAKFEMSAYIDGSETATRTVNSLLSEQQVKLMSIPGVESSGVVNIGTMFTLAYNLNRNADSHMLKNSEWGAVAYLTHSSYGRNKTEVTSNSTMYSGQGPGNKDTFTGGSDQVEGYLNNGVQSTTGNAYGIYDLVGGKTDVVAGYLSNSTGTSLTNDGLALINADAKYKNEYTEYSELIKGDAVYEISSNSGGNGNAWNGDSVGLPSQPNAWSDNPFFSRGWERNGLFGGGGTSGQFLDNQGYACCRVALGF